MGISRRAQTGDLGANLKRMFARIRQREIQDFLRNRMNNRFGLRPLYLKNVRTHESKRRVG